MPEVREGIGAESPSPRPSPISAQALLIGLGLLPQGGGAGFRDGDVLLDAARAHADGADGFARFVAGDDAAAKGDEAAVRVLDAQSSALGWVSVHFV